MKEVLIEYTWAILLGIGFVVILGGISFYEYKMNQQMMECRNHYPLEECKKLINR